VSGTHATTHAVALAALVGAGCQLATDFDLVAQSETSEELCSDGKDTDFDGLVDCQDWNCLDKLVCCDIPEVVLEDDFDYGPEDCEVAECAVPESNCTNTTTCGPDADKWNAWPCPYPRVCGGAFRINKQTCFPAGALSEASVTLDPGLLVEADFVGRPERRGYIEVALTLQDESALAGSVDACGRDQRVEGFAALRQVWSEGGYQISAQLQQVEIGLSAEISDTDTVHRIALEIDRERTLVYYLDGEQFAVAPQPVPPTSETARVALSGLTDQVAITRVRVEAGLRCHDPRAWTTAGDDIESSMVLSYEPGLGRTFDADEVFSPSASLVGGKVELYYTGCHWEEDSSQCEPYEPLGVGLAHSTGSGPYARDDGNPILSPNDIPEVGIAGHHRGLSVDVFDEEALRGYLAPGWDVGIIWLDDALALDDEVLPLGEQGSWDQDEICCVTAVEHPDGATYLWYAGRPNLEDHTWKIGVAIAEDGVTFERASAEPVLEPGPAGSFDSEAVTNPVVVYDASRSLFRMWYEGRNFFGETSIGYAVSTDGIQWHKYPGNPVIEPEDLGMASIGGPDVHLLADGPLRAWVHGTTDTDVHRRIFELHNDGALIEQ